MNLFINSTNITLEPNVHPYTIINTNATQVAHQNPSSPKAKRPLELTKHVLDSNHTQIS